MIKRHYSLRHFKKYMSTSTSFYYSPEDVEAALRVNRHFTINEFLLSLLDPTAKLSRPPISRFQVALASSKSCLLSNLGNCFRAAGLGKKGAVYLGVNLEFPGVPLYNSVHAEQFLIQNALNHGEAELQLIALNALPCGHCRQFFSELHNSEELKFIFQKGCVREALLSDILPLRFRPEYVLGEKTGDLLMAYNKEYNVEFTEVARDRIAKRSTDQLFLKATETAKTSAAKSYVPYSGCLSAVAILTKSGNVVSGSCIENVAYNPTLPSLQAAIISGISENKLDSYSEISSVIVVEWEGKQNVNQAAATSIVLQSIAPLAEVIVLPIHRVES